MKSLKYGLLAICITFFWCVFAQAASVGGVTIDEPPSRFIYKLGETTGLTPLDLALLLCCPIAASLGTLVSGVLRWVSDNHQPQSSQKLKMSELPLQAFVGLVLGLVVALYFVGAITQDVTSLARVVALCILLGYQAPSLWTTQEKVIKKLIDKRVEELLDRDTQPRD